MVRECGGVGRGDEESRGGTMPTRQYNDIHAKATTKHDPAIPVKGGYSVSTGVVTAAIETSHQTERMALCMRCRAGYERFSIC